MEKLKKYDQLSEDEKKHLIDALIGFILNHPYQKTKNRLRTFYKSWVCNGAKVAAPTEHEDNMLFYDNIIALFKDCRKQLKN